MLDNLEKPESEAKHFSWKNLIKNRDIFGHKVQFNFNQKDSTYKTIAGGLFSIVFKACFFYFAGF